MLFRTIQTASDISLFFSHLYSLILITALHSPIATYIVNIFLEKEYADLFVGVSVRLSVAD